MAKVAPAPNFDGNPRLRRHSESLSRLDLPNDNRSRSNKFFENVTNTFRSPKVTKEETEEGGKVLFGQILVSEMEEELPEQAQNRSPDNICEEFEICSADEYTNHIWAKTGQELRLMADKFKKSKERQEVKHKAQMFGRKEITKEQFRNLLTELLIDGITKERIIVLFFFCADVAIASLQHGAQPSTGMCLQYINWSLEFIMEKICTWVQENGGWGKVFSSSLKKVGKFVAVVGVLGIIYYGVRKMVKG